MLFHRIVPSLLIQTGAIRSNSVQSPQALPYEYRTAVQADEALERRQYELNARIRFNHRGQVAMAMGVSDDSNNELQPQFFITTADASYLDEKHVLFGTLGSGSPTIFNAIRINGTAVDEGTNQPLELEHAPRVLSTKIVENEIHTDLVAQQKIPWRLAAAEPDKKKKKKKRKGKLDVNVLSFGDEMGDVQSEPLRARPAKNSDDPAVELQAEEQPKLEADSVKDDPAEATTSHAHMVPKSIPAHGDAVKAKEPTVARHVQNVAEPVVAQQQREPQESLVDRRRSKYAKRKKSKQEREEETLARLVAFQQKIGGASKVQEPGVAAAVDDSLAARMARREEEKRKQDEDQQRNNAVSYHGQILESDGEDDHNNEWIATKFKCRRHIDHSAGADGRNANEYDVVDDKTKRSEEHHKKQKKHKKRKHA